MNSLDAGIVALHKRNARMSVTQISQELGVSRVTIDSHIKKLEKSGVITGYTITLDSEEFRQNVTGWIMINVTANAEEKIIASMAKMPEITRLHHQRTVGPPQPEIQTATRKPLITRFRASAKSPGSRTPTRAFYSSSRIS